MLQNHHKFSIGLLYPSPSVGLLRLSLRGEDNIKMNLRDIGWEGVVWMHLAQVKCCRRTLLNMIMNLRFP
jgi:hypothetical protein